MAQRALVAARLAAAALVAIVPTLATHALLRATGPIGTVALWCGSLAILIALRSGLHGPVRHVIEWGSRLLAVVGGLTLIAAIVIIPLSTYLLWMELVPTGVARGAVSFVFVMLVGFGSALYGGHLGRNPVTASAAYVAWIAFLSIPLFEHQVSVVVLVISALILLATAPQPSRRPAETGRAAIHGLLLLGLTVLLAAGLGASAEPRGSRIVDRFLSPRFRQLVVSVFPEFPIMYDVPGYGYRLPSESVASNPVLSNRAIFRVSPVGSVPIYLRTEVFHVFTGAGWQVSNQVLTNAPQEQQIRANEPGGQLPLRPSPRDAGNQAAVLEQLHVDILTDFYPSLPHTLDTQAVSIPGRDRLLLERPGEAIGYAMREPLMYGEQLTLYRRSRDPSEDQAAPIYLDVAPDTSVEIRNLAASLVAATPSETIVNTLRYLREDFEYTLEPPQPADRSEFLNAFLFDHRRGFCVQFATAFTVISRLQGIPTRYVTGFLVQPPPLDYLMAEIDGLSDFEAAIPTDAIVTGYSAHAWPEVWLPETGWRVVEATPPMQPYGYENSFFSRFESIRDEGRTVQQLQEALRMEAAAGREERSARTLLLLPSVPPWLIVAPVLVIVLLVGLKLRRPGDGVARFQAAVKQLRSRSVRVGYPRPEQAGWTRWAKLAGHDGERVASLILSVFFGGKNPTDRDVRYVRTFTRRRIAPPWDRTAGRDPRGYPGRSRLSVPDSA